MKRKELEALAERIQAFIDEDVCPTCGRSPEPKHEARKPHPNTMAGK